MGDDAASLRLLAFLMASEGYAVQTAHSAENAMALFHSLTPDAVLTDIHMPGMDGLQLTRLIKATEHAKHIPVLQ